MINNKTVKRFIKKHLSMFPFIARFWRDSIESFRNLAYFLPFNVRLQKGMPLRASERRHLVKKLYNSGKIRTTYAGKKVLCWEPSPFPVHTMISSYLGTALSLRGCQVEQVICDGTPIACTSRGVEFDKELKRWKKRCSQCYKTRLDEIGPFGLKTDAVGDFVDPDLLLELREIVRAVGFNDIPTYKYKGVKVGEYALTSLMRYYKGEVELKENLLREYLFGTLVITEAAFSKINKFKPDVIYMSHGIYVSWGPALIVALLKGIPVIRWSSGFRKQFAYFRKITDPTKFHQGDLNEKGWEERLKRPLSSGENEILDVYLRNRYKPDGSEFADIRPPNQIKNKQKLLDKLNIDGNKPIWCIFSHLNWENPVTSSRKAYRDYNEWIIETIKTIKDISNIDWLIKIHPAEKMYDTTGGVRKLIKNNFPNLPSNIKVIPPDTNINTYDLYQVIAGGITCLGTAGLELAAKGKPVILAAEAFYSKKGFTCDGLTSSEYQKFISEIPLMPAVITADKKERARKFAYSYFIERQIPFRILKRSDNGRHYALDWQSMQSLLPGEDPVLDMICERFFTGKDFVLGEALRN